MVTVIITTTAAVAKTVRIKIIIVNAAQARRLTSEISCVVLPDTYIRSSLLYVFSLPLSEISVR